MYKLKHANSILESLEYFSKIDPYNFELYRFKVGAFLLRHSVHLLEISKKQPSDKSLPLRATDTYGTRTHRSRQRSDIQSSHSAETMEYTSHHHT